VIAYLLASILTATLLRSVNTDPDDADLRAIAGLGWPLTLPILLGFGLVRGIGSLTHRRST
jgi:hypothetical protein